jgi:hypothetical protein
VKAFFDLGWAPWRMALRGTRLWLAAELDGLRLLAMRRPAEAEPRLEPAARAAPGDLA